MRPWGRIQSAAHEFRGFVVNRQLVALSQYNADLYFKDLVETHQEVGAAIPDRAHNVSSLTRNDCDFAVNPCIGALVALTGCWSHSGAALLDFYERVTPKMPIDSFVCDLAMREDQSIAVIEINMHNEGSSAHSHNLSACCKWTNSLLLCSDL